MKMLGREIEREKMFAGTGTPSFGQKTNPAQN
jgi:hypothetical protein